MIWMEFLWIVEDRMHAMDYGTRKDGLEVYGISYFSGGFSLSSIAMSCKLLLWSLEIVHHV